MSDKLWPVLIEWQFRLVTKLIGKLKFSESGSENER